MGLEKKTKSREITPKRNLPHIEKFSEFQGSKSGTILNPSSKNTLKKTYQNAKQTFLFLLGQQSCTVSDIIMD